jgi:hypothetical protein
VGGKEGGRDEGSKTGRVEDGEIQRDVIQKGDELAQVLQGVECSVG